MKRQHRPAGANDAGYSVAEMLVVVAIIGLITLVSIPQFMTFQRNNQLKTSMRQIASDLRLARQQAITLRTQTRIRFQSGAREYSVEQLSGSTWRSLSRSGGTNGNRSLEKGCSLTAPSNLPTVTVGSTTYNAVIFLQDGTASISTAYATFEVRSAYSIARPVYTVRVESPGFVKAI